MNKLVMTVAILGISIASFAQTDSSTYFLQKGLEEKTRGRRMESLKQFEKAYSYNKENKQVVSELAAAYLDLRRYIQAKEKYQQLEKMGDQSDSTYRQLMNLCFNTRQFDDAIKYALLLKKVNPSEKTAFIIGKSNYEKENLGEAIKYLDIATKEDPQNAEIPYSVARAYSDMQNYKAAIPYFQKAVQLKPDQSRWIYEMALIYYAMNDDQNSLKYMLEAADKGYKKDNEYLQNLSTAYLNAGKFNEGIAVLTEVLQRRPSDMNILNMLAEAYYDAKKYDDAIKYYDQILTIDKTKAEALYMIGLSFQKKGEKEKGMALCDKAIQMDPSLQNLKQKQQMPGF
ncbi:MAG TPA: tetratricopeptide repeat protein [Flavisolibacter sp.]|nr:tetratricopeptide repeat protein [Flavisolibacter sp.]